MINQIAYFKYDTFLFSCEIIALSGRKYFNRKQEARDDASFKLRGKAKLTRRNEKYGLSWMSV